MKRIEHERSCDRDASIISQRCLGPFLSIKHERYLLMLKPLPRLFLCSMDVEYDISLNCYDFLLILPILGLAYLFIFEDNLKIHLTKPTSSFPINHPINQYLNGPILFGKTLKVFSLPKALWKQYRAKRKTRLKKCDKSETKIKKCDKCETNLKQCNKSVSKVWQN